MYSEAGILRSVGIMFPGNRGIGTAIEAEVNSMKKTIKIGAAFMFLLQLHFCAVPLIYISNLNM